MIELMQKIGVAVISVSMGRILKFSNRRLGVLSYYCHKHNGPGLRYEIGASIYSGNFVWANGPFSCGSHSDVVIFRSGLKKLLQRANEKAADDKMYRDPHCIIPGMSSNEFFARHIRARHESANGGLKSFHAFSHSF